MSRGEGRPEYVVPTCGAAPAEGAEVLRRAKRHSGGELPGPMTWIELAHGTSAGV